MGTCEKCGQVVDYNGWSNYETWAIHLWLTGDEGLYRMITAEARRIGDEYELADFIKKFVNENNPIEHPSMYADLLQSAIDTANYREIAAALLAE